MGLRADVVTVSAARIDLATLESVSQLFAVRHEALRGRQSIAGEPIALHDDVVLNQSLPRGFEVRRTDAGITLSRVCEPERNGRLTSHRSHQKLGFDDERDHEASGQAHPDR